MRRVNLLCTTALVCHASAAPAQMILGEQYIIAPGATFNRTNNPARQEYHIFGGHRYELPLIDAGDYADENIKLIDQIADRSLADATLVWLGAVSGNLIKTPDRVSKRVDATVDWDYLVHELNRTGTIPEKENAREISTTP